MVMVEYTPKPYSNYEGPYIIEPYYRSLKDLRNPLKEPYSNDEGP